MQIWLLVAAIALFVAAIIVLIIARGDHGRQRPPRSARIRSKFGEMPEFGPRQLGPGAIVSYGGIDYVVRGSVTLREGPFVWWEHLIEGGTAAPIWFSVEEDEGRLKLAMWVARKDLLLQPGGVQTSTASSTTSPSAATPATPARARPVYPRAAKWTLSTTATTERPPCWFRALGAEHAVGGLDRHAGERR